MCARYTPPRWDEMHGVYRALPPENLPVGPVFPRGRGAFIRPVRAPEVDTTEAEHELVVGQWGLIPSFAKAASSNMHARQERKVATGGFGVGNSSCAGHLQSTTSWL